jgi:protein-disulfide isomerase
MVCPIMLPRWSAIRSWVPLAFALVLLACVKHPSPAPGKVAPPPPKVAALAAPSPAPPPAFYDCENPGAPVRGDDTGRICVPYSGTLKGDPQGLITIVMFTDFQCPFCSRVTKTLEELEHQYSGRVRLYLKHNPLPFHTNARLAAQAAVAAERQGKLWEMHDTLFAHQTALERESLIHYAQELGLDPEKLKADLDSAETAARVDKDLELAKKLGVQGTPNFFVNGRAVRGAVPIDRFQAVIEDELLRADRMGAKIANGYAFYVALMGGEGKGLGKPEVASPPPKIPIATEVHKIELGDAPQRGGKEPKLTLVAFLDFQCPYCSRVKTTLDELLKRYKGDLRVVFHHFPLPFHQNAMGAAVSAEAAGKQGRFWEMHDLLLANQSDLSAQELEKHARAIGLDMAKYRAAVENSTNKARVEEDVKLATRFGVGGTPSFFLNGRAFSGAYPLDSFIALLDEEIKHVDALLAAGTPRAEVYAAIIKDGLDKAAPKKEEAHPGEPQSGEVYKAEIKGAPIRGAKDALVTIVEYSDFQCPFCSRVQPTLGALLKDYSGKVRVVWHNLPLPFHDKARPAAIAALAAGRQGKFWEMHDLLFKNQSQLSADEIEGYAKEIGLDLAKFRRAMKDDKLAKGVDDESAAAAKIGARGTPAFFINGTFLSGAQPLERFRERVDEELAKAKALVKKGTPRAKVYDAIMKHAKTEVEGARTGGGASDEGPAKKVEVGDAPSRGPTDAPVTIVVFSDLQCPFCGRLEPTLADVEKSFPGKIRVVWKNFPLAFHAHGKPAAEAALAAHEQGKFWAMHARIFQNQTDLNDSDLERYAQEIGLDMAKYKAAISSHKFAATVEADIRQGNALGVEGTPASFVNGLLISGAQPPDVFKAKVKEELAKRARK